MTSPTGKTVASFKFPKEERLTSKKVIQQLFSEGKSVFSYPVKLVYLPHPPSAHVPAKVLVTIPKKNFRKATSRNYLKRLLREAYRVQKNLLLQKSSKSLPAAMAIIYVGKDLQASEQLQSRLSYLLKKVLISAL